MVTVSNYYLQLSHNKSQQNRYHMRSTVLHTQKYHSDAKLIKEYFNDGFIIDLDKLAGFIEQEKSLNGLSTICKNFPVKTFVSYGILR